MAITPYTVASEPVEAASQNVKDLYKGQLAADIRAELEGRRSPMVSIFMNLSNDFNKATAIRANNCFLGREVYLVGKRKWDRRGAVGSHHYQTIYHADTLAEVVYRLRDEGYTIYAVDNIESHHPTSAYGVTFPAKSAFLYGEEQRGLSPEEVALCDEMVYLEAPGATRSLNVASAAAALMFFYNFQQRERG